MEELELHVFDFDGTLFRSPQSPAVWSGDWWADIASLSYPSVPEKPGPEWWIESTVSSAKKAINNPNVYAILMTGRKTNSGFRFRVPELLSQQNLNFDFVQLSSSGDASQEKMNRVKQILNKYPNIKKIKVWDDRPSDLEKFKTTALSNGIELENIELNYVQELSKNPDFNFENFSLKIDPSKLSKPSYIGIFLDSDSKSRIIKEFGLLHEKVSNDHVTISFKSFPELKNIIGKQVKIKVIGYAEDKFCQTIVVDIPEELKIDKKNYHITISHSKNIDPKYSNELLENGFQKINGLELTGIVDVFPRSLLFEKEITARQKIRLKKISYQNKALDRWFKEKWVDISRKDKSGKYAPCGRSDADKGKYPKCRPSKKVNKETPVTTRELTDKEEKAAIRKKRKTEKEKATQSAGGGARKPKRAPTIKKSNKRFLIISGLLKIATEGFITSFDFDQTIRKINGALNESILSKIVEAKNLGKIYLVTSRVDSKDNVDFVIQYLKDHKIGEKSIFSYFDGFYFTGTLKTKKLQELGVSKHYDDNDLELELAEDAGISGVKV